MYCDNCGASMNRQEVKKRWHCNMCGNVIQDKIGFNQDAQQELC